MALTGFPCSYVDVCVEHQGQEDIETIKHILHARLPCTGQFIILQFYYSRFSSTVTFSHVQRASPAWAITLTHKDNSRIKLGISRPGHEGHYSFYGHCHLKCVEMFSMVHDHVVHFGRPYAPATQRTAGAEQARQLNQSTATKFSLSHVHVEHVCVCRCADSGEVRGGGHVLWAPYVPQWTLLHVLHVRVAWRLCCLQLDKLFQMSVGCQAGWAEEQQ